jgi:hypothetical protein
MEFAVCGLPWWDDGGVDRNLQAIRALGATHIRFDYWMHDYQCGDKRVYAHDQLRKMVAKGRALGLKFQFTISGIASKSLGIPKDRAGNPCHSVASGLNPSPLQYKKFIKADLPFIYSLGVRRISLWNEPNLKFFLALKAGKAQDDQTKQEKTPTAALARRYYDLYKKGLEGVRELQKEKKIGKIEVLIGELSGPNNAIKFMDKVLSFGKLRANGIAMHPYQFCTAPDSKGAPPKSPPMKPAPANFVDRSVAEKTTWQCRQRRVGGMAWIPDYKKAIARWRKTRRLTSFSGGPVPLFLTEWALLRSPYAASVSENIRVKWYPKAMNFAWKHKVKQMLIFQLGIARDPNGWDSGMIDHDGVTGLPAYHALKRWAKSHGYKTQ